MKKKNNKKKPLNPRQELFAHEWLVDHNGSAAAVRAGYAKSSAAVVAHKSLLNPKIQNLIRKTQLQLLEQIDVTAERILAELACIAFFDPLLLTNEDGRIKTDNLRSLPEVARRCIQGAKVKTFNNEDDGSSHQEIDLKIADKLKALELLMKYHGMFAPEKSEEKVQIDWDAIYRQMKGQIPDEIENRLSVIDVDSKEKGNE